MRTDPISEFAQSARAYCTLVDDSVNASTQGWRALAKALAQLHSSALELPETFDENTPKLDAKFSPNPEGLAAWISVLAVDVYRDIFEPFATPPEEPVCNSLADDLSDIYEDVRRGLALFEMGHAEAAAWEWRFHFFAHWGEHLVGAQRAIFLASRG